MSNEPTNPGADVPNEHAAMLKAALQWHADMGVDAVVAAEPIDWLSRGDVPPGQEIRALLKPAASQAKPSAAPVQPTQQPTEPKVSPGKSETSPAKRQYSPAPPDRSVTAAREAAASVATLAELAKALAEFDGCGLKATAKNTCVFRGAETARLMVIGEAPGRDEDLQGKPFVGRAGQLLDKMLAAIGIDETKVHITNVVYWRPPGNRTPTPLEAQICRPFLERQVSLVAPDIILLMGGAAAKNVLETTEGIMRLRGKWKSITLGGHEARVMPTLHPAYLLRTPAAKRMAWRDLLAAKQGLAA